MSETGQLHTQKTDLKVSFLAKKKKKEEILSLLLFPVL